MAINHQQIMSWNAGIIKKRLNPDSTFLLQDQLAAFVYGLIMSSLLILRKDMLSCIIAHGTTNFTLAFYVKHTEQYGLW